MLAALMLAAAPAALGVLRNASFTPETPVRILDRSSSPTPEPPQRPGREIEDRTTSEEDRDSGRMERQQAHNEGDDRAAHRPRPAH